MATIYFPSNLYREFWEKIASNNNQTERGDRAYSHILSENLMIQYNSYSSSMIFKKSLLPPLL